MNKEAIQKIVEDIVQQIIKKDARTRKIPMAVSARHCHLSQGDLEVLFGKGFELTKKADLSQPGQFAANETVIIAGPRGSIENVRILGPARSLTQVEVSKTDSIKLGVKPPVRESGNIKDSASITLIGPKGSLFIKEGLIIAQAHIHMTPEDAETFGVANGEYVRMKAEGERPISFERVLIRVSARYKLEMHIDTDEANAGFISSGHMGSLEKIRANSVEKEENHRETVLASLVSNENSPKKSIVFENKLLSQRDVQTCNDSIITIHKYTIVTPLARDTARELGKTIRVID
jgi:putative phosphotransacetylase